jgi:hypothetical protein
MGKHEGRRPLGRPWRRWEDNIGMNLPEVEWGGIDWIDMARDMDMWQAVVSSVINLRVPKNTGNFLSSLGRFSFSGRTLFHGVSSYLGKLLKPVRKIQVSLKSAKNNGHFTFRPFFIYDIFLNFS